MEFRGILDTLGIPGRSRLRRQRALIVTLAGVVVLIAWLGRGVHAEGPSMIMSASGVRASGVITEVSQSDAAQPGGAVDVGYLYRAGTSTGMFSWPTTVPATGLASMSR